MKDMISNTASMTSKEIAELVAARHDNVKRSINNLVDKGVISHPPKEDGIKSANGIVEQCFVFTGEKGKRDSIVVVAQLSPEFTGKLVDRWLELEAKLSLPQAPRAELPEAKASAMLDLWAKAGAMFKIPDHLLFVECTKAVQFQTGIDLSPLLLAAPAMDRITSEVEYLEPTEIGKILGISGKQANLMLEKFGFHERINVEWTPTEKGKSISVRHAWKAGNKTGYNYKWNVVAIEKEFSVIN